MFYRIISKCKIFILFVAISMLYFIIMSNFIYEQKYDILKIGSIEIKNMKKINPHNYDYIINPEYSICHKNNILLIFTVITRVDSFDRRQLIRSLWSNYKLKSNYEFVFMVGKSSNQTINEMVKNEFDIYEDIVQENFIDSYWNLTLKSIMSYKWVSKYCRNSVYVVKIDDDVNLHFKNVIEYFSVLKNNITRSNFFNVFGKPASSFYVERDQNSKYYVPYSEYNETTYPYYLAGPAYIYTKGFSSVIYNISNYVNFMRMEDVYFGLLIKKVKQINSTQVKINDITDKYNEKDFCSKKNDYFFYYHLRDNNEYRIIFNYTNFY